MERPQTLPVLTWLLMSLLMASVRPASAALPNRPKNLLVIMADDLAAHAPAHAGNRWVKTPNLDRLSALGVTFRHAYCNAPVCTASRQSLLTGRLPHEIGVTQLSTPLSPKETTLATLLTAAGFETRALGKMHFNSHARHGFQTLIDRPQWVSDRRPSHGLSKDPRLGPTLGVWRPFRDPAAIWLNSAVLPYPARDEGMFGTWLARQAQEFLSRQRNRPFYLVVSFHEPHSPFHFPLEDREAIMPSGLPVPPVLPSDGWQIPEIFLGLTREQKQGIRAAYYTSLQYLDRNVGRILQGLEKAGLAESTLVVLVGDNGYLLGEHGRFEKHCLFEEAVRVPLILAQKGKIRPALRDAMVELVDVAPTVLDCLGLPIPQSMTGRSFRPVLEQAAPEHREDVFSLYTENEEGMIRDRRWKLIVNTGMRQRQDGYRAIQQCPGRVVRLYDLQSDPGEARDLSRLPEFTEIRNRLEVRLAQRLVATYPLEVPLPSSATRLERIEWCLAPRDGAIQARRDHR